MQKNLELSSMIHRKFPSEAACARHLGWPRQRLNRIVNGKMEPTIYEVDALSECLGVPLIQILEFYLPKKSTIG